jgi:TRAP-type C4-dicarboxylate transport system permease small subunit
MREEMENRKGFLESIIGGGGYLGILSLAFMVVSISYDVILRYVFYAPTYWALEMNTFLLAFLTLIPAGDVLRFGSQIRITVLYDRLGPGFRARLDILRSVVGAFFCAIMVWKGVDMAWKAFLHNDRMSTSLGTPMVIPYLFLPIGFGLLGLQYLMLLKRKEEKTGRTGERPSGEPETEVGQQI